jgi:hypothetical protein
LSWISDDERHVEGARKIGNPVNGLSDRQGRAED